MEEEKETNVPQIKKEPQAPAQPSLKTVIVNNTKFDLTPEEYDAMAKYGIEQFIEEHNKQNEPEEPKNSDDSVENVRLNKLEKNIRALQETLTQDISTRQRQAKEDELNKQFANLSEQFEETKNDPEFALRVKRLTISRALEENNINIVDIYKDEIKALSGKATEAKKKYVEDKLKDKDKTAEPSKGDSPGNEPEQMTWKDFKSGKVRKSARDRLKSTSPFRA